MKKVASSRVNPGTEIIRVSGHFGELVQGRLGPGGPVALVTLPCPVLVTEVRFEPAAGELCASQPVAAKTLDAARRTLEAIGMTGAGGRFSIRRPVEPGLGAGSSTAETLGAVRAVARAFGARLGAEMEAQLCLAAEGAIDPLMHPGLCLFASREGRVLHPLPDLPTLTCIGGFAGAPRATVASDHDFPDMTGLFFELEGALTSGDAKRLGIAATESARANQARNPSPAFASVAMAAERLGAFGVAVAHTGAAITLLMPPDAALDAARAALVRAGVRNVIEWRLSDGPRDS